MQMLTGSRVTRGVEHRIREHRQNAEAAVQVVIYKVAQDFASLDDAYLAARASDVREVGNRILRNLTQTAFEAFKNLPGRLDRRGGRVVACRHRLARPQDHPGFRHGAGRQGRPHRDHGAVAGPARRAGHSRAAPLRPHRARRSSSTAARGASSSIRRRRAVADYRRRQEELERDEKQLGRLRKLPSVTRDGQRIGLVANVELPREAEMAMMAGAEGVGLLRTEFLFMNRDDVPDENEQYQALRQIVETMEGRPVTIRTLDVGGEKLAPSLRAHLGDSANPALGLRAIRLSLKQPRSAGRPAGARSCAPACTARCASCCR